MDIQRLRNLTTGRLHTKLEDIYADIDTLTGEAGAMTHMLLNACRALEPYLREVAPDARLWDGAYDVSHAGQIAVPQMNTEQRAEFWKRFGALPSTFAQMAAQRPVRLSDQLGLVASMKLVLIRGLPGSGKSTIAKALYKAGFDWFEADTYHLNDEGDYCYDPANVKEAHERCQRETFKALANGKCVVVSNTFTRRFEMEPYFEMAKTFGIEPNILEATGNWPNVHGVPAEVVEKMRQRWEKSSNVRAKPGATVLRCDSA